MNPEGNMADLLNRIDASVLLRIVAIFVASWAAIRLTERFFPWLAERIPGRFRLNLLAWVPVLRLAITFLALILVIPLIIHPSLQNLVAVLGAAGLAIGFALKDYSSSLVAGIIAVYERPYRPGDWVEINGIYGEVKSLGLRAFRLVTPDDTVMHIPHKLIWESAVGNANDGQRDLLCVADFFLDPDHDPARVREKFNDVALASVYTQLNRPIAVTVAEKPGYTHYRLKAYPVDGRDQFRFTSDLTQRGKEALGLLGVKPARIGYFKRDL
jgi:small conductance mechanosensitive channel